jgi:hypothetical protein
MRYRQCSEATSVFGGVGRTGQFKTGRASLTCRGLTAGICRIIWQVMSGPGFEPISEGSYGQISENRVQSPGQFDENISQAIKLLVATSFIAK